MAPPPSPLEGLTLVVREGGEWVAVGDESRAPCTLLFNPSAAVLGSAAYPHGAPPGPPVASPLPEAEATALDHWQRDRHAALVAALGRPVAGYVTHRAPRPGGVGPIVLRELPDAVGTKVWRGEWLLWQHSSPYLADVRTILEIGAGTGLCGILLAADHKVDVTVSDTSTGYPQARLTFENLRDNVERNRPLIEASGGHIKALDLDWNAPCAVPSVDLVIGSDVLYEPFSFPAFLDVLQRAAQKAILVQNVRRSGTDLFRRLCADREIPLTVVAELSPDDAVAGDGAGGTYELWHLDLPPRPLSAPSSPVPPNPQ